MSWEFSEDDETVDVERIYNELGGHPAIAVYSYLGALKKNAPRVYERLGKWARAKEVMSYVNWTA